MLKFSSRHSFVLLKLRNVRLASLYPNCAVQQLRTAMKRPEDVLLTSSQGAFASQMLTSKCQPTPCWHTPQFSWAYRFLCFGSPKKVIHATYHLEHETLPLGGDMISQVDARVCFMSFNQVEHELLKFSVVPTGMALTPTRNTCHWAFHFFL